MIAALVAAVLMVLTDVIAVIMTQAEAANHGWLAGWMDAAGWIPGIICTTIAVEVLDGPSLPDKASVIVLVGAANLFGTKLGQITGQRILTRRKGLNPPPRTIEERVAALEALTPGLPLEDR